MRFRGTHEAEASLSHGHDVQVCRKPRACAGWAKAGSKERRLTNLSTPIRSFDEYRRVQIHWNKAKFDKVWADEQTLGTIAKDILAHNLAREGAMSWPSQRLGSRMVFHDLELPRSVELISRRTPTRFRTWFATTSTSLTPSGWGSFPSSIPIR